MQALAFCKERSTSALFIIPTDGSSTASDFNEYSSRNSANIKHLAKNTGFPFHSQIVFFMVTDSPLLGKVLLRQRVLEELKIFCHLLQQVKEHFMLLNSHQ